MTSARAGKACCNTGAKAGPPGEGTITARLFSGWAMARPDPEPLSRQAFRIVTEDGSGVQVTGILLDMTRQPATAWL